MNFKKTKKDEVVIFGVGKLGKAIINSLYNLKEYYIIAIDESKEELEEVKDLVDAAIVGDATEEKFLEELGIDKAKIFIVAIGNNLQSSILISSLLVDKFDGRVIVRSENKIHRNILKKLGINTIINPNLDSAQKVSIALKFPKLHSNLNELELVNFDENVSFGKLKVPEQYKNKEIKNIQLPKNILIAFYVRDNVSRMADGDTILQDDDQVYILGDTKKIYKLFEEIE